MCNQSTPLGFNLVLKHFEPFYQIELMTPTSQKHSFGHKK